MASLTIDELISRSFGALGVPSGTILAPGLIDGSFEAVRDNKKPGTAAKPERSAVDKFFGTGPGGTAAKKGGFDSGFSGVEGVSLSTRKVKTTDVDEYGQPIMPATQAIKGSGKLSIREQRSEQLAMQKAEAARTKAAAKPAAAAPAAKPVPTMTLKEAMALQAARAQPDNRPRSVPLTPLVMDENAPGPNGALNPNKDQSRLPSGANPTLMSGTTARQNIAAARREQLEQRKFASPQAEKSVTGAPKPLIATADIARKRAEFSTAQAKAQAAAKAGGGNSSATAGQTYTVRKGETLSQLAQRVYGNANAYRQIAAANGISDPNKIKAGQVLKLPTISGAKASSTPKAAPKASTSPKSSSSNNTTNGSSSGGSGYTSSQSFRDWIFG